MMNVDFTIKNPLWAWIISWVLTAIGFGTVAVVTVLYFTISMDDVLFSVLEAGGGVFGVMGLLCDYICFMEKFELKDGVFRYRKPFKKKQSASVQDIDRVEVHSSKAFIPILCDVIFYGKDGKKLINFLDDGTSFQGGQFIRALQALNIPISYA